LTNSKEDPAIPKNIEAEQVVLGSAILEPEKMVPVLLSKLKPEDFYRRPHRVIFRAIRDLFDNGKPSDVVSLANMIEEQGNMQKIGGRLYLNELMDRVTTTASMDHYVDIIRKKATKRALIEAGSRITEAGKNAGQTPEEAIKNAQRLISEIALSDDKLAPIVESIEGAVTIEWLDQQIKAEAVGLKEQRGGEIGGHLTITTTMPGVPSRLRSASFNFCALRTREQWAKSLNERMPYPDWPGLLEDMCTIVVDRVRAGDPVQIFSPADDVPPPEYAIEPLLLKGEPTILFGKPSSTKSYTALLFCYLAALGQDFDPFLWFAVHDDLGVPLYLDWEAKVNTLAWRAKLLTRGMGWPDRELAYRRCKHSLADDIDQIRLEVLKRGTKLVVIDSLGLAAGDRDLNASDAATRFYGALRTLDVTSLIIAHTAKHSLGRGSVFGSTFFEAGARSIWQVVSDSDEGAFTVSAGIQHRKINDAPLSRPFGLRWEFKPDMVTVEREDLRKIPSMSEHRATTDRIVELLLSEGILSPTSIAKKLNLPESTVRPTLTNLTNQHRVTRVQRGQYAAAVNDRDKC